MAVFWKASPLSAIEDRYPIAVLSAPVMEVTEHRACTPSAVCVPLVHPQIIPGQVGVAQAPEEAAVTIPWALTVMLENV